MSKTFLVCNGVFLGACWFAYRNTRCTLCKNLYPVISTPVLRLFSTEGSRSAGLPNTSHQGLGCCKPSIIMTEVNTGLAISSPPFRYNYYNVSWHRLSEFLTQAIFCTPQTLSRLQGGGGGGNWLSTNSSWPALETCLRSLYGLQPIVRKTLFYRYLLECTASKHLQSILDYSLERQIAWHAIKAKGYNALGR